MSRAIAMSKPIAKDIANNSFSLSIMYSHSNSHSCSIAKPLIIAVARAKLFPKLQLKANLYLKTGLD